MYIHDNEGDINADGRYELVVTYKDNGTFHTQVYKTQCGASCSISLWTVNSTEMSGMEALPFLLDRFGNGSVSIFTFKGGVRTIISVIPHQTVMYCL